jgi:acid phosphatase (class A)
MNKRTLNKRMLAALSLFALSTSAAYAKDPVFASPEQTHTLLILAAPPAFDSETTKAELAELHQIEGARSEAQVAKAKFDDENENIFVFKDVFGDAFTKENLPLTAALGDRVKNDEGVNNNAAKTGFHRVRPYNLDKTLHPVCKTKIKDDSYPSGHSTSGYIFALTLIDMAPEKRDEILARAEDYAHNRLVCGVHYSSDLPASRLSAYTIHAVMETNPQYQKVVAEARAELRSKLGLPAN